MRRDNDRILVGFNRRYAPLLVEMRARFGESSEPTNARYLVNAGRLASDSWYRDSDVEGSRFVGEGGHFVDTLSWWIGSDPVEVVTMPAAGPDELQMSLRYDDGSLATITYLTNAHRRFPKETFEASTSGRTARLDNFRRTTVWSGTRASRPPASGLARQGPIRSDPGISRRGSQWWADAHLIGIADDHHACHPGRRDRRHGLYDHTGVTVRVHPQGPKVTDP